MSTGSYSINGTELLAQPTEHQWIPRIALDISGDGRPIYPAIRQYQLRWDFMSPAEFNQVQNFYLAVRATGTAVIELPQYGSSNYYFYAYSGCTLQEPETSGWFNENLKDVMLIIDNIRT